MCRVGVSIQRKFDFALGRPKFYKPKLIGVCPFINEETLDNRYEFRVVVDVA